MARIISLVSVFLLVECVMSAMYSSELIHRFSDELKAFRSVNNGAGWPEKGSFEYYKILAGSDARRHEKMKMKMKLGAKSPVMVSAEGSATADLGNEFGWLHYTWIDIGMPSVAFLVALDTGSDLLWLPCDCVECAPLAASYYDALDRDLNMYDPSGSNTSKHLPCTHKLCDLGPSCDNPKYPCPYNVSYLSENVSSSGLLVEDVIHLASRKANASNGYFPVIIGCGKRQSGEYLNGVAPDGVLGLGVKEISVPSRLAKDGVIQDSFSLCFNENDSGRIYFGDQGPSTQQTTSLLPLDGKFMTYITGVEECCIGDSCLDQTSFKALIDCGTSFTHFPGDVYGIVVKEFDRQINSTKTRYEGVPWEYCYKGSSSRLSKVPSMVLKLGKNNSFVVRTPTIDIFKNQGSSGFCLAIQPTESDIALIGQNYIRGYRMVFDRENLKLGWSPSNCDEVYENGLPHSPPSNGSEPIPFPRHGNATAPDVAVAERTPDDSSATQPTTTGGLISFLLHVEKLLLLLLAFHQLACVS